MKKLFILSVLFLTACVTINIYFPAAAAEKAADKIIKGIQESVPEESSEKPEARFSEWQLVLYQWIDGALNVMIAPVQAAEANLSIDSPEIRRLQASMTVRFATLKGFYDSGFIGIKSDGLLTIKDATAVPLKDRNKVNSMVAAENQDRENLYHAIANANGQPDWYGQVKSTFAKRWVSNAQSGWWYQTSDGTWKRK